jgi:hypothetical protein
MLASVVQTSSVFKVVDWERHGDVQSSAVPPGHALPLTDLLEFGVDLQARAVPGVGLQTQRTTDSTVILDLNKSRSVLALSGANFSRAPSATAHAILSSALRTKGTVRAIRTEGTVLDLASSLASLDSLDSLGKTLG